jgi:thiol-disulfide isomerase/thioredoxin
MLMLAAPAFAGVVVGDKAPALSIREWVRGDAVDIIKNPEKKLHLVEIWATWCPPCKASIPLLTNYQKKFSKDLVIIGITDPDPYQNSPTQIRQFVKSQGTKMDYHVAMDDSSKTAQAYMDTGEAAGIPHAVLVGRDGKVAWQGSPLDPAMEQVISGIIDGTYDVATAAKKAQVQKEIQKRFHRIDMAFQLQKMDDVWAGLIDIMKLDPANDMGLQLLASMYVNEADRHDSYRKWVRSHIDANRDNPLAMATLTLTLCRIDEYDLKTPELAMEAAKAAYKVTGGKERYTAEIYARTFYQIGAIDRAIELQQEAVAAASADQKATATAILNFYKKCKTLSSSSSLAERN